VIQVLFSSGREEEGLLKHINISEGVGAELPAVAMLFAMCPECIS